MPDILSHGQEHEREPGPRPRRRWALVALAVAALATLIVTRLPGHHAAPHHPARPASQGTPPPGNDPGTRPHAGGPLPSEPSGISGPTAAWDASLRLPVTGSLPAWFYPASGRQVLIAGLSPDQNGYTFTRADGGWAVQSVAPAGASSIPGCAICSGLPVYFLADGASRVSTVGSADAVAPGPRPGTLWLTSRPSGAAPSTTAGTAQLVSATGRGLAPPVHLPTGYLIEAGTIRGLLLTPAAQGGKPARYLLWDPATRHVTQRLAGVIAVSPGRIAWQSPRRLHLLDLASGQTTTIPLGRGNAVPAAAFSPDGDYLALQVTSPSGGDSGSAPTRLEVARVTSRRLSPVPGTSVSSDALAGFGWPDGQDRLVAELSFTTKVQVAAWRPGAALLAVAAVTPGQPSGSMVTG